MGEFLAFLGAQIADAVVNYIGYTRSRAKHLYFWISGLIILACLAALVMARG
ncbi:hypothetical protein [Cupriavidus basilensis]|uniref:hypothetical protein n=1 Tax=Cupriavidus basilensis TaxID=68895 RepID=UPI0039F68191